MKKSSRPQKKKTFRGTNQFFIILLGLVGIMLVIVNFHLIDISKFTQPNSATVSEPVYEKPSASFSFVPNTTPQNSMQVNKYSDFDFQAQIDPSKHKISVVHPVITYDPSVFRVVSVDINTHEFPADLQKVDLSKKGVISFSAGINLPLDNAVTQTATVATIHMRALKATDTPSSISYDKTTTALSVSPLDPPSGNVVASTNSLFVSVK